jgi:hypothetical protein
MMRVAARPADGWDWGRYAYPIDQCVVLDRASLVKFRERRSEWLVWLKHDEHHAIWTLVSNMA